MNRSGAQRWGPIGLVAAVAAAGVLATGGGAATSGWVQISSKGNSSVVQPSLAQLGNQVIVAWHVAAPKQNAEVITFTPDRNAAKVAGSAKRVDATTGWSTLDDPLLLTSGPGLQILLSGVHSGDFRDPLNGVNFAQRNPDGSFGPPVPTGLVGGATGFEESAIAGPDGSTPIFVNTHGGQLVLYVGATRLTGDRGVDLAAKGILGGNIEATGTRLGRDANGRYWLRSEERRVGKECRL